MGNDVKLKIDGDASGLLASVKTAMAQIEQEGKKLKLPSAAAANAPGVNSFLKSNQEARVQVQNQRNEENNLKVTNQLLKEKSRELDAITKSEKLRAQQGKDTTAQLAQQKKISEDIIVLEKQKEILGKNAAKRQIDETRAYKELLSNMAAGFKSGGMGGIKGVWGGMSGLEKAGFGATAVGGILGATGAIANYIGQRPIDIARMQSSAISMTTGRQLGEARSGEYTYESMYGDDRKKAQEQATSSNKWKTVGDIALAGVGVAAVVGSAFLTGGASLAALAGGGALLKSSFVDKGMLEPTGKYAAFREQREAQDFTTMLAASHEMGPYRKDAIERLKATGSRDLGMQRILGLKDSGYYNAGGYLQSQMGTNFTDEMVTKASQGILGAGGSTAMALQSGTSLQAQRGLGLTNSDQLLGQLSGTQSIPETSKKSLIEIFARGFDSSKYAEENRKYMQAVTEQVYKGGATSTDAADKIADMIRATVTGTPTTRNVEAGRTAFEAFQAAGTATSGYLGGINIASAMQDKDLRKIKDPAELNALLKLKPNEIDETDSDFIASAQKMGLTGPELAKKLRNRQIGNIRTSLGGRTGMAQRGMIGTLIPGLGAPEQKAFANLINQEETPERDAEIAKLRAEADQKMTNPDTGKAGDTMVQASAQNAKISLETLSQSINKFAEDAMIAAKKLGGEATAGRANETPVTSLSNKAISGSLNEMIKERLGKGPIKQEQGN